VEDYLPLEEIADTVQRFLPNVDSPELIAYML
jgi:hypothetical protein